jgi:hypothetical protein
LALKMVPKLLASAFYNYLNKMKKILTTFLVITFLNGCTVYTRHSGGTFLPSLANNYEGLLAVELSDSYQTVEPYMVQACSSYGGLKHGSAYKTGAPPGFGGWNFGYTYWKYSCNGRGQSKQQSPTLPKQDVFKSNAISIDEAKKKCADLGLKPGVEAFGKCVLQLTK